MGTSSVAVLLVDFSLSPIHPEHDGAGSGAFVSNRRHTGSIWLCVLMRLVDIDGGTGGLFVAFHKFLNGFWCQE